MKTRTYSKDDVQTRHVRCSGRNPLPCVNVKAYRTPTTSDVVDAFPDCSEAQAEKACQYCWDSAVQMFWEDIELPWPGAKAYSDGRSGGWLVVDGLPSLESWDAIMLGQWRKFERQCRDSVAYLMSWKVWRDNIEENRWHENGAEQFNFADTDTGTVCLSELKAKAMEAGFGAVVRP